MSRLFQKILSTAPLFRLWGCDNEVADGKSGVPDSDFIDCDYDQLTLLIGCWLTTHRSAIDYRIQVPRLPVGMKTADRKMTDE